MILIKMYWRIRVVLYSCKWIFRINLADRVYYQDRIYLVANGVRSGQWRLDGVKNNDDGWVPRSECKKVIYPKDLINSFRLGYRFYMVNWYSIWLNNGIKPWMKKCNIW